MLGSLRVLRALGDDMYEVAPAAAAAAAAVPPGVPARVVQRDELLAQAPAGAGGDGGDAALVLHTFDMGGQEDFRGTQQIHLAGDALYLLCVRGAPYTPCVCVCVCACACWCMYVYAKRGAFLCCACVEFAFSSKLS